MAAKSVHVGENIENPLVELSHVEKHYGDLHVLKNIREQIKPLGNHRLRCYSY